MMLGFLTRLIFGEPPATRLQYGANNFSGATAPDRFSSYEEAMRNARERVNAGAVYANNAQQQGGVRPGDAGMRPTRDMYYGVLRANLRPSGFSGTVGYYNQWQQTPTRWDGDAPVQMQPRTQRNAPWLRRSARGPVRVVHGGFGG